MNTIIVLFFLMIVSVVISTTDNWLSKLWQQTKHLLRKKKSMQLFDDSFIEPKAFYLREFGTIPCVAYIGNVNVNEIVKLVKSHKYGIIQTTYQRNYYNWEQERIEFAKTIYKLQDRMLIRLGADWSEIYYRTRNYAKAEAMLNEFKTLKAPQKESDYEINIISLSGGSLDLKTLAIKPTKLDIDLYYNDDFKVIDAIIKERLAKETDKGIVLLHGLPGTGKTTYLRHLIGNSKKKVMFVSPSVAGNLMNPDFMDLLIDNPDSILVIEDAENIIMDRKFSSNSSVSNLLNISDGLLSDCLNVQIICTFNSSLSMVDQALLRKGRLIAKYEFGKLDIEKAQRLSDHLELKQIITKPSTLAEITNPGDKEYETEKIEVVGFRRKEVVMN